MALNPFFLQGSSSEQRLVQDLINEQLKIYGIDVIYIPRKIVNKKTILEEVQSSKFDDNYYIEAYINTYDGYSGAGDILTKFGMSLRDELTITVSKERFEDFISPFLSGLDGGNDDDEIILSSRPREGDLIYFPLGERLFEVKFVEHEQPFYQLGKNYVYELKCELFEYEDEVIDTSIDEVDKQVQEEGYIATLSLIGLGRTAQAVSVIGDGYVNKIYLNNDGFSYTSPPLITFSPPESPFLKETATAVAIGTYKGGRFKLQDIYLTSAGVGYTTPPSITISGGGGSGAAATCSIQLPGAQGNVSGVIKYVITDPGSGYVTKPSITVGPPSVGAVGVSSIGAGGTVTSVLVTNPGFAYTSIPTVFVESPPGAGTTAVISASLSGGQVSGFTIINPGIGYTIAPSITVDNSDSIKDSYLIRATGSSVIGISENDTVVETIYVTNPGFGYTVTPPVTISNPDILTGIGTYLFNEVVVGSRSQTRARIKDWDESTGTLKISFVGIGETTRGFYPGENVVGTESGAIYTVKSFGQFDIYDKYSQNDEIEEEADLILDFTESNPFGDY